MQFIQGKDIPLTLQLIKSDNSYEEDATVTYDIYHSDLTTYAVSAQAATWNDTINCYHDELDVSVDWVLQEPGNYILKWNISDTDYFAANMIEEFCVLTNASSGSGLTATQEAKIDAIQADLDNPDQYKADVSTLAPSGEYNTRLTNIQTDLDDVTQYWADLSSLATSAQAVDIQATVDTLATEANATINTNNIITEIDANETKLDIVTTNTQSLSAQNINIQATADAIQLVTDTLPPSGEYDARLVTIQSDLDDVTQYWADLSSLATSAQIVDLQTDITKLLGLNHENIYMDQPIWDVDENLTSLRIRTYSSPLSVGTEDNVIATYRVTADGQGSGKFSYWKQVELL